MRDLMGAQSDIHRHTGAHFIAEDLNDLAYRLGATGRTLGQLNHHHKAHACATGCFGRDQDIKAQAAIIRHHKAGTGIHKETTDNLAGFRHQHTDDTRFTAALAICSHCLCQHHITVDCHFHLLG
ncbi:hypothetical protein D3C78_1088880 [compost metagenome]